ncbi:branched-chain amino acid ABC transporter ATP-binding protein/permease [Qaidamihabitans albus]|uniref:branched-chain amino acid ABC transporter ATP-binding protein/permease n=1 Tax=Qaidamihabitans albus TaxID=2795733 RepID=UPI0018F24306|nr:ATP-binding cassette domain-containing protein [Qaidamihabitans albus]
MIDYVAQVAVFVALFAILASSYSILLGTAGTFSAAHAAFFGTGAYTSALLVTRTGMAFPLDMLLAGAAAFLLGLLVSVPLSRLPGEAVLVASLALQLVFLSVLDNAVGITGGTAGLYAITRPELFGQLVVRPVPFAALAVVVAVVLIAALRWVESRRANLAMRSARDDLSLALAFGVRPEAGRFLAWSASSFAAGCAGAVFARFVGYISPVTFGLDQTLVILTMLIVGGLGNVWGAAIGAAILVAVPEMLSYLPSVSSATDQIQLIIYSVVLLAVVMLRPQGLWPERNLTARRTAAATTATETETVETAAEPSGTGTAMPPVSEVTVSGVHKQFGGVRVLQGVDLTLCDDEVTAILGPNGAGKTTLFNIIAGQLRADEGRVLVDGQEATSMRAPERAARGIARSFQDARLFASFTVYEYLAMAAHARAGGINRLLNRARPAVDETRMRAALQRLRLDVALDDRLTELSYGQQKLLILAAMALWDAPVLLLDEIAAGLDARSTREVAELVRSLRKPGRVICLVEHNLEFVWAAADRIVLLGEGRIIADGTPGEIRQDPQAFATYFGKAQWA